MATTKSINIVGLVKGILLSLLGVLHMALSFCEYNSIKEAVPSDIGRSYILWFYAVGLYVLLLGLLDLFSFKGIRQNMLWAWRISVLNSIFCVITGVSGMIGFKWTPSPPYLIFLTGIVYLVLLIINIKDFKNNE